MLSIALVNPHQGIVSIRSVKKFDKNYADWQPLQHKKIWRILIIKFPLNNVRYAGENSRGDILPSAVSFLSATVRILY